MTIATSPAMTTVDTHPASFLRKRASVSLCGARSKWIPACAGMTAVLMLVASTITTASEEEEPVERTYVATPPAPAFQSWAEADQKSAGCVSCHTKSDRKTMHANEAVVLGCTDCHGGDAGVMAPAGETYSADDGKRGWSAGYL